MTHLLYPSRIEDYDDEPFYRQLLIVQWWRLLPFGLCIEEDGAVVLFDRNYSPIARIRNDNSVEAIHPLTCVRPVRQIWLYCEETAPYRSEGTLRFILTLTRMLGLQAEVRRRWELSDYGYLPVRDWEARWAQP